MNERLVRLAQVENCRDFGGYDAADGRKLARGRLFRSAHFAEAGEGDIATLNALGVSVIVDLRRPEERENEPNKWPGAEVRQIANDEGRSHGLPPHLTALLEDVVTPESVAAAMRRNYALYPFAPRYVALFRDWFAALDGLEGAALIHCAAGKDRTGLACALTLHALGVPEDAIIADYELTNEVMDIDARVARIRPRAEARIGRAVAPEALRAMVRVEPDYLRASFDAIGAKHQSLEDYFEATLGVDAAAIARLRVRLTD